MKLRIRGESGLCDFLPCGHALPKGYELQEFELPTALGERSFAIWRLQFPESGGRRAFHSMRDALAFAWKYWAEGLSDLDVMNLEIEQMKSDPALWDAAAQRPVDISVQSAISLASSDPGAAAKSVPQDSAWQPAGADTESEATVPADRGAKPPLVETGYSSVPPDSAWQPAEEAVDKSELPPGYEIEECEGDIGWTGKNAHLCPTHFRLLKLSARDGSRPWEKFKDRNSAVTTAWLGHNLRIKSQEAERRTHEAMKEALRHPDPVEDLSPARPPPGSNVQRMLTMAPGFSLLVSDDLSFFRVQADETTSRMWDLDNRKWSDARDAMLYAYYIYHEMRRRSSEDPVPRRDVALKMQKEYAA